MAVMRFLVFCFSLLQPTTFPPAAHPVLSVIPFEVLSFPVHGLSNNACLGKLDVAHPGSTAGLGEWMDKLMSGSWEIAADSLLFRLSRLVRVKSSGECSPILGS